MLLRILIVRISASKVCFLLFSTLQIKAFFYNYFLTFSRTRSIWTKFSGILHKILNHSDWKKTKNHFDQIVSTTMGQSYRFLTRFFFSYFHFFRQHFHQFLQYFVKSICRSRKFFENMPKNMMFLNFCK